MRTTKSKRVGILGGTFNPPHLGHIALARCAREQLDLQRVVLIPASIPPHKHALQDPGPQHRLKMCELAVQGSPGLSVCDLEIQRDGPSYTVDTLRFINSSHPDVRLTFILGADMARTLPDWREPTAVLELANLAVAERDGVRQRQVLDSLAPLIRSESVTFLDFSAIEVSSSMVREQIAQGMTVKGLVGTVVFGYLAEQHLYREPAKAQAR